MSSLNARGGWKYHNTSQMGMSRHGTNTQQGVSTSSNVSYLERVTRTFFDRVGCPASIKYATRSECFSYAKGGNDE